MEYLIEVKNLNKTYPGFSLKDVSFKVPGGCIMGLIGENGAGKSTTIKAILDLIHTDSGNIRVLGKDIRKKGKEIREDIGVVLDGASFHETLRAKEIGKFMGKIYQNWDEKYYQRLLKTFNIPGNKPIKNFSTGMKMKLMIVAAMAHHPKLLILDEATSGLDPVARDEILDLFFGFIEDGEHSVLIASHITSDLDKVADYVTMIHNGSILFSEEKDQLLEDMGILRCGEEELAGLTDVHVVGVRKNPYGVEALIRGREYVKRRYPELVTDRTNIEEIMLYSVRRDRK